MPRLIFGLAAILSCAMAPATAFAQCSYDITAVIEGPACPEGGTMPVTVLGLNDLGQAVGYVEGCPGSNVTRLPFVWSLETGMQVLPLPGSIQDGIAKSINNVPGADGFGAIACTLNHYGAQGDRAFRYDDGVWTILPPPFGFSYSAAQSINDAGQIVGSRLTSNGLLGFRWQDGVFTDILGTLGNNPLPLDVNVFGHAVGEFTNSQHAFKWNGATLTDLGTVLGGSSAFARTTNNSGAIGGGAMVTDGPSGRSRVHAYILTDETVEDLGVPDSFDSSQVIDLNDAGQMLVRCFTFLPILDFRTFLWQNGAMKRLDELVIAPPDITVTNAAEALNNHGQIITTGLQNGKKVGLLLSPAGPHAADVNFDCAVDFFDLMEVIDHWGACVDGVVCRVDVVANATFAPPGDGKVDGADLAFILGNWLPGE